MGIEQIKEHIKGKVEEKVQEILRRAKLVREREVSQAKKKLEEWIEEQTKIFMREKISLVAQYKARTYREIALERTKLQEDLWQEFVSSLKERIEGLRSDRRRYSSVLLRCLDSAYRYCSGGVKVLVNPQDASLMNDLIRAHYRDCDVSVFPTKDVHLGLVLVDENKGIKINYDLISILEAEKERIKSYLFSRLK